MNIFVDLDGTLLDCRQRLHRLFGTLVPRNDLDENAYWDLKRIPQSHDQILASRFGYSEDGIERFKGEWLERIESPALLSLDRPLAGSPAALETLGRHGALILLTSRQSEDRALAQLRRTGLHGYFEQILVTGRGRSKADAVRDRGIPVDSNDIVVGDTGDDIVTARELGARAISVLSGFRCEAYLTRLDPDGLYADLSQFAAALDRTGGPV